RHGMQRMVTPGWNRGYLPSPFLCLLVTRRAHRSRMQRRPVLRRDMDTPAFATASTPGGSRLISYEQLVKVSIPQMLTDYEKQRKESYVSEEERTTLRTGCRPVPVAGSGTDLWLTNLLLPFRQRRRLLAHRQARRSGRECL